MTKHQITLERRIELGANQEPVQSQQKNSELSGIVDELQDPARFALGALAVGVFLTLVILPMGLIALPLITAFMRFLGL